MVEKHTLEIKSNKEAWKAAEKIRRDKWMDETT